MSASLTVSSRQFGVFPISTGLYPREGSRCVSCQYDWTSTTVYNEDLTQLVARGFETTIQSAYIDNSSVSQYVSLTAPGTGQILKIPPYSQGFFPLFVSGMGGFTLTIPGPEDSLTRVLLCNVPAQSAAVWKGAFPPSFSLDFTTGSLGAGAVFTRASPGWYYNSSGVLVQAANDAPRFDYDPVTLRIKGLLLEDASTNIAIQSGNLANAAWSVYNNISAAPVQTANQTTAPDGTLTGARIVYPAVVGGGTSVVIQNSTYTATPYAFSLYLKGAVGGEQLYLGLNVNGFISSPRITLTTTWQRFSIIATALAGAGGLTIGTDLRDGTQTNTPAQTVYAWGAQVEAIGYVTSYIPTLAATVTRAADVLRYPIASVTGFDQTKGTLAHEYISEGAILGYGSPAFFSGTDYNSDYINLDQMDANTSTTTTLSITGAGIGAVGIGVGSAVFLPAILVPANVKQRGASAWAVNANVTAAHNGAYYSYNNAGPPTSLPVVTDLRIAYFMHYQAAISQWARRTRYWPRQLSQADLIALTR
jgi:hypothetical protein